MTVEEAQKAIEDEKKKPVQRIQRKPTEKKALDRKQSLQRQKSGRDKP